MTYLFYLFTLSIITPILLAAYRYPRKLFLIIPVIFAIAFGFTLQVQNYEGYAVSDEFIAEGSEGVILYAMQWKTHYYVMLSFHGENEPRLVKIARSEETDKQMEKNDGETTKVLRFLKKRGKGVNGEGGIGGEGSLEILDLNKSDKFGKDG